MFFYSIKGIVLLLFFLSLTLHGCGAEKPSPSDLAFGFKSYTNYDEIRSTVAKRKGMWRVIEKNGTSPSDKRPPYEYIRVVSDLFDGSTYSGSLVLIFYNDLLMAVWFYPEDWESYKKSIAMDKHVEEDSWENITGNVRAWIKRDHTGKRYMAWEDVTLSEAMQDWLEKFS